MTIFLAPYYVQQLGILRTVRENDKALVLM